MTELNRFKQILGPRGNNQIAMGLSAISTHSSQLGGIRAALEWSFGPNGDNEVATRLAAASLPWEAPGIADDDHESNRSAASRRKISLHARLV